MRARLTKNEIAQMRKLKRAGMKLKQIADIYSCAVATVDHHTSDIQSLWTEPKLAQDTVEAIRTMRRDGMTLDDIAVKAGVSAKTVRKYTKDIPAVVRHGPGLDFRARASERRSEVKTLRDRGLPPKMISRALQMNQNTVYNLLHRIRKEEALDGV